ncbi:hypothetical protein [Roseivirga seohaensis]|nr:hypothetical protein [Roseivirga seohaensis]
MEYKIIHKGPFEKIESFEKKLNALATSGWRIVTSYSGGAYLILGRSKH